jgi:hypothetical protein
VRILLPSGQSLTGSVDAWDSVPEPQHVRDLSEVSPHEFLQRTVLLKAAPREQPGSLEERHYESVWLRLWARREGISTVEPV